MIDGKLEAAARACARVVRNGRGGELVVYLRREEGLSEVEAIMAAMMALQAPLDASDVSLGAVVSAVRRYVLEGRSLTSRDIAESLKLPKSIVPVALRQLQQEGLIQKQRIPNAPAYCTRWVRKVQTVDSAPVAQWEPKSQFKGPND